MRETKSGRNSPVSPSQAWLCVCVNKISSLETSFLSSSSRYAHRSLSSLQQRDQAQKPFTFCCKAYGPAHIVDRPRSFPRLSRKILWVPRKRSRSKMETSFFLPRDAGVRRRACGVFAAKRTADSASLCAGRALPLRLVGKQRQRHLRFLYLHLRVSFDEKGKHEDATLSEAWQWHASYS